MDSKLEKDCSALGGLFQAIINDMRRSSPIWEDFTNKATKLNSSLKTTQIAISAFLDTFQKVADMATGSRGATREMGSSLTRLCMRHRSIENKIKTLASTITENLVAPLQEKMEEWKRNVAHLDKEHAKEYKKASQEIKKCAADTIRLQKKVKKGKSDIQSRLESALQDVNDKYLVLEETEKNAVRTALIEERSRFCMFVTCFKPFVEWEISLLTEITHLKEVMDNLSKQSSDPHTLPAASEQVILDVKGADSNVWAFQTTKNLSSQIRKKKQVTTTDSASTGVDNRGIDSNASTPSENPPSTSSTWNNWPSTPHVQNSDPPRPHTISSAYEKTHSRPALSDQVFVAPSSSRDMLDQIVQSHDPAQTQQVSPYGHIRAERPKSAIGGATSRPTSATIIKMQPVMPPLGPKPKSKAVPPPTIPGGQQPTYVNMTDLAHMAAEKQRKQEQRKEQRESKLMSKSQTQSPCEQKDSKEQKSQAQQNSLELAIKELEATTAALTSHYEEPTTNAVTTTSRTSLQCSSGYGTMNSTPAGSEDTIASGGLPVSKPPASGSSRRTSGSKPPPPVRRSSSVSTGSVGLPPVLHKLRSSPSKQGLPASGPQAQQQQPAPQQMAPPQQSPISHQTLLRHPKPPIPTQQQPPPLSPASPKSVKLSQPDHSMQHSPGTKHRRHLSGTDSPPNPMILRDGDSGIITGGLGIHLSSARTSNNKVVVEYAVPEVSKPLKAPITATKSAASSSVSATPTAEGSPHASVRRSSVIDTYSSNYAALRSERRGDKPTQKEDGGGGEDDVDRGFPLPPPPTEEELAAMGVLPHPCNAPMTSVLSEMKSAQRLRRLSTDSSEC